MPTPNELAVAALRNLHDLESERRAAIAERRPLKAVAARIRRAKAEFRRCARLAGVEVSR